MIRGKLPNLRIESANLSVSFKLNGSHQPYNYKKQNKQLRICMRTCLSKSWPRSRQPTNKSTHRSWPSSKSHRSWLNNLWLGKISSGKPFRNRRLYWQGTRGWSRELAMIWSLLVRGICYKIRVACLWNKSWPVFRKWMIIQMILARKWHRSCKSVTSCYSRHSTSTPSA